MPFILQKKNRMAQTKLEVDFLNHAGKGHREFPYPVSSGDLKGINLLPA
jgi:hypothetical protein